MLLVLVPKLSNRLQYTMQLMLGNLLGLEYRLTTQLPEFLQFQGPKFSYGVQVDDRILYFASKGLLFEKNIANKELSYIDYAGSKVFFSVSGQKSPIPFDLFSASFYLVSRYEEYLPHLRDSHNRYKAVNSEAFRNSFLMVPLVNRWSLLLKDELANRFPELKFKLAEFTFELTIDIDAAYAYKNKGLTRALGGIINSWNSRDYAAIKQRLRVLAGREPDPFDTFDLQLKIQRYFGLSVHYFVLLADYGTNDKNIPHNNRHFQQLLKVLADYAEMGIHPSYASAGNHSLLATETGRLSKILNREITHSRQHFLRLTLPHTYRNLINSDISHDYTMGYADQPGFRASICTPFYFYDLDQDLPTNLLIHPFCVMDGTLNDYMNLNPAQAVEVIRRLIDETRHVGGTFMPLWHNQSLNSQGQWKGWLEVFISMIEMGTGIKADSQLLKELQIR